MSLPSALNLFVARGTDNDLEFTIKDSSGTAIDITADTVTFTARQSLAGAVRIPTKTNAPGGHTDPLLGLTTFTIAKEEIDDEVAPCSDTIWVYEVRLISGAVGNPEFVHYQGDFTVKPTVNG